VAEKPPPAFFRHVVAAAARLGRAAISMAALPGRPLATTRWRKSRHQRYSVDPWGQQSMLVVDQWQHATYGGNCHWRHNPSDYAGHHQPVVPVLAAVIRP